LRKNDSSASDPDSNDTCRTSEKSKLSDMLDRNRTLPAAPVPTFTLKSAPTLTPIRGNLTCQTPDATMLQASHVQKASGDQSRLAHHVALIIC
jgi:hypothetical protein